MKEIKERLLELESRWSVRVWCLGLSSERGRGAFEEKLQSEFSGCLEKELLSEGEAVLQGMVLHRSLGLMGSTESCSFFQPHHLLPEPLGSTAREPLAKLGLCWA